MVKLLGDIKLQKKDTNVLPRHTKQDTFCSSIKD